MHSLLVLARHSLTEAHDRMIIDRKLGLPEPRGQSTARACQSPEPVGPDSQDYSSRLLSPQGVRLGKEKSNAIGSA